MISINKRLGYGLAVAAIVSVGLGLAPAAEAATSAASTGVTPAASSTLVLQGRTTTGPQVVATCSGKYGIKGFAPVRNSAGTVVAYNVDYYETEACTGAPIAIVGTLSIYDETNKKTIDATSDGHADDLDLESVADDVPIGPKYQANYGLTLTGTEPGWEWTEAGAGCTGVGTPTLHCAYIQPFTL